MAVLPRRNSWELKKYQLLLSRTWMWERMDRELWRFILILSVLLDSINKTKRALNLNFVGGPESGKEP